jgi:hypothetical protein
MTIDPVTINSIDTTTDRFDKHDALQKMIDTIKHLRCLTKELTDLRRKIANHERELSRLRKAETVAHDIKLKTEATLADLMNECEKEFLLSDFILFPTNYKKNYPILLNLTNDCPNINKLNDPR